MPLQTTVAAAPRSCLQGNPRRAQRRVTFQDTGPAKSRVPRLGNRRELRGRRTSTPAEKVLEAVEGHPKEVVYRIRREDAREDEAEHDPQEHQTPVVSTEAAGGGCECLEPLLQRNNLILRERVRVLHVLLELIKMLDDLCLLV